jgi:hypothetical protein
MIMHIRRDPAKTLRELVEVIDRFIDDRLAYDLEWDDFVSWKSDNAPIEQVRDRIAALEPLFFSDSQHDRDAALAKLVEQRNEIALLVGVAPR